MAAPVLSADPLRVGTPEEASTLFEILTAGGLSTAKLQEMLGLKGTDLNSVGWWSFQSDNPALALVRLFFMKDAVPLDEVEKLLAGFPLARLEEFGLVRVDGNEVAAPVHLQPFKGSLLAVDWPAAHHEEEPVNSVIPVSMSGAMAHTITPRHPVGRVLDLGAGSGIQSIAAARHADHVVATDINVRALNMAVFNAWLNGTPNIEVREGPLYEPVAGELFDLIVANPPFIIAPEVLTTYAEGGMEGDSMSEAVVVGAGAHLVDDGIATAMMGWGIIEGDSDSRRPTLWAAKAGCDAVVMVSQTEPARLYAHRYCRTGGDVQRWIDAYRAWDFKQIGTGCIRMRKRSADSGDSVQVGSYQFPFRMSEYDAWEGVERLAGAVDIMHKVQEADLEQLVLRPASYHLMNRYFSTEGGEPVLQEASVLQSLGLSLSVELDIGGFELLRRADGERTVGQLMAEAASQVDEPIHHLIEEARRAALALVGMGVLIPVDL